MVKNCLQRIKYKHPYFINTISPDEIFNKKFGELQFIGRDLHKIVFPSEQYFKRCILLILSKLRGFTRLVEYKKFTKT